MEPEREPELVEVLRRIVERELADDNAQQVYLQAGADMFLHQPGREALAVLMGQYAQRALQRGGRPGELPCAHFSTLSHLFGAALGCCCEHSDAGTTAKYVLSMKVLYCVEDGQERGLCAEPTVLQSPLWRNVELLEEVAWEALAHEKEQTMLQAGPGSQVSDSEDWKERREEAEQREVRKVMIPILDLAVTSGGMGIHQAYEYVERLKARDVLTDEHSVEALHTQLDRSTLVKLSEQQLGNQVDRRAEWESSPFNRGQAHDRYGFEIQVAQPELHIHACKQEERGKQRSAEQAARWREWLQAADAAAGASQLARGGVPHEMRAEVWSRLAHRARSALVAAGGESYATLCREVAAKAEELAKLEPVITIDQDLPRTFPKHRLVDTPEVLGELRRILVAYVLRNPGVGYCQSMNFICAMLLVVLEEQARTREESTFWTLALLEERLLSCYHTQGMTGCQADTHTLMTLTERYLPTIHAHLERHQVLAEVAFVSWFLCLFFNVLPTETCLRVWDCMLAELARPSFGEEPVTVVFTEEDTKLGLTFPAGETPLTVEDVSAATAKRHPELRRGLSVLAVQGQTVIGLSYEETKRRILDAGRPLRLTFAATGRNGVDRHGGNVAARDVLIRVGLAVLDMSSRQILAASDPHELNHVIRAAPAHLFDADALIFKAFNSGWEIDPAIRAHREKEVEKEARDMDMSRHTREHAEQIRETVTEAKVWLESNLEHGLEEEEVIIACGGSAVVKLMDHQLHRGSIFLTSFRLVFVSREPDEQSVDLGTSSAPRLLVQMPLVAIDEVSAKDKMRLPNGFDYEVPVLRVSGKDCRRLFFIFDPQISVLMDMAEHDLGSVQVSIAQQVQIHLHTQVKNPRSAVSKFLGGSQLQSKRMAAAADLMDRIGDLQQQQRIQLPDRASFLILPMNPEARLAWTGAEQMREEWERQGLGAGTSRWRATVLNNEYQLCPTYPQELYVPAAISDEDLQEVAKYRSKQRLPALSWLHPSSHAAIVRCAQPLVGVLGRKSDADERLFALIAAANPESQSIAMLDARPVLNAVVNKASSGGGVENVAAYQDSGVDANLVFLNIENIHVMRDSLQKLHSIARKHPPDDIPKEFGDRVWVDEVIATGWLGHVGRVLSGARLMVSEVSDKSRTVVLHCSDGWDRTAQLCSLAELCLDPYYRTSEGFRVLVMKEWEAFGHKFRQRLWGETLTERSPIFFQFLDSVWQMLDAFPAFFQFNETLLLRLVDMVYANTYSNFRFDCERERSESQQQGQGYVSCWDDLVGDAACINPSYDPALGSVLRPPNIAKVWVGYFNRWMDAPLAEKAGDHSALPVRTRFTLQGVLDQEVNHWSANKKRAVRQPLAKPSFDGRRFQAWEVLQEGWLYQHGRMGSPKRRYFVMLQEGVLVCYDAEPKSKALVPVDTIRLQRHNFHVTRGGAEVGAAPGDGAEGARFPFLVQIGAVVHTLAAESSESFAAWTSCLQQASGRRDIESTVSTPRREKAVRAPDGEGLVVSPAAGGDAGGEAGGEGLPEPEDVVVVAGLRADMADVGFGESGIRELSDGGVILLVADNPILIARGLRAGQRVVQVNGAPTQNKEAVISALLNAARHEPPKPPLKLGMVHPTPLDIAARMREKITADLKKGQRVCWTFLTEAAPISVRAWFGNAHNVILPPTSFGEGCDACWAQGSFVAEGEGELNFEFDNSSSWFNGRAVQCTFSVAEPAAGDTAGKELEHQLMKAPDGSYTLWYQ